MSRHEVGKIKLTGQNADGTPKLVCKQTRSQLHRQVWLQREAQTARSRNAADGERVFHVGGEPPAPERAGARAARPPAKYRPATGLGQGASAPLARRRARTARPFTAPELAAHPGHGEAVEVRAGRPPPLAVKRAPPPAPTADRRPFSPRAPRGFYDSRAHGQIWIDRRSAKERSEGVERVERGPADGNRWCGGAEAKWKAARGSAPASVHIDPMSSARSAAAAAAVVELREQLEPAPALPGESQAAALRMDGYRPRQHGKDTFGHPLHFASAPFNRAIGRAAPPWRKSSSSLSDEVESPLYQKQEKKKKEERRSLHAHVPGTHFSGRNSRLTKKQQLAAKEAADAEVAMAAGAASRRSSAVEGWGGMPCMTPPPTPPLQRERGYSTHTMTIGENLDGRSGLASPSPGFQVGNVVEGKVYEAKLGDSPTDPIRERRS